MKNRLSRLFLPDIDQHPRLYAREFQRVKPHLDVLGLLAVAFIVAPVVLGITWAILVAVFGAGS